MLKIGITHGDFNGVNYELLLKIFEDPAMTELGVPVIYGSPKIAGWYAKSLNMPQVKMNVIDSAAQARQGVVNIINITGSEEPEISPGKSTAVAGKAALVALEQAVYDLKEGKIDVLVTAPINKENIQGDGFNFPGHTEFLEAKLADDVDNKSLMILCSDYLRVALVTGHIPLGEVATSLNVNDIVDKLRIFNKSLEEDFSIYRPKIAVLACNPHGGDHGVIGKEDDEIVEKAISEAENKGILAFGPYPADGFFGAGTYKKFDGVLAIYHDQGLIPFKTIAMDDGVNFTAGLPYIRTSPDHGTAYDIAGKNIASPDSLRKAIYMAIDFYRNRKQNRAAKSNPLKKHYATTPNNRE